MHMRKPSKRFQILIQEDILSVDEKNQAQNIKTVIRPCPEVSGIIMRNKGSLWFRGNLNISGAMRFVIFLFDSILAHGENEYRFQIIPAHSLKLICLSRF